MSTNNVCGDLPDDLTPKILPWQHFEDEVAYYVQTQVESGSLAIIPSTAQVRKKPRYFSRERADNIEFDISIEVRLSPAAGNPTFIWLWECKDYPTSNVPVDDVEELDSKMRQVGAHKATVVTRKGFAKGALSFAKSRRISLMTLVKKEVKVMCFSRDGGVRTEVEVYVPFTLFGSGKEVGHNLELNSGPSLESVLYTEFEALVGYDKSTRYGGF